MSDDYSADQTFNIGDRVELHPGCDLWMRGAKFGTIHAASVVIRDAWVVRMDHPAVKNLRTFKSDRLRRVR
jgi:hypothetical protein